MGRLHNSQDFTSEPGMPRLTSYFEHLLLLNVDGYK